MKRSIVFVTLVVLMSAAYAQKPDLQKKSREILAEAKVLYKSEKASWHATDILVGKYPKILENVKGYLSYADNDKEKTIFWDKNSNIIFTAEFSGIPGPDNANVDTKKRKATDAENDLIDMRQKAFDILIENKDEFFTFYKNVNPNLIPLINDNSREVFILSASDEADKLLLGNDYKLTFNKKNEIIKKIRLHNSLIELDQKGEVDSLGKRIGSVHSHVIEDLPFMTSTDICTYLLYKDVLELTNHVVVSKDYISIFDAEKVILTIVSADKFNKEDEK
jgi:hypothetical protein